MSQFDATVTAELAAPLKEGNIKSRSKGSSSLSYIEAHHAIREANRIFGFGGWVRETVECRLVQEEQKKSGNGSELWYVGYVARVRITVDGVIRDGCGFGQGQDRDLGGAHESAIKEAESDAMKRAFMTFGDPFGLALYDKTQANVEKASAKRVEDGEQWLRHIGLGDDIENYKADCKLRGFNWEEMAKKARGAQVRDVQSLEKYVNDQEKKREKANV